MKTALLVGGGLIGFSFAQRFVDAGCEEYWLGKGRGFGKGVANDPGGVDLYVGGVEHAVLHLLYARFWHKVLFDLGHVSSEEPFRTYFSQGYIQAPAFTDDRGQYVPAAEVEEVPSADGAESTWTWQGQPVNREFGKKFGDNAYAFEELDIVADRRIECLIAAMPHGRRQASEEGIDRGAVPALDTPTLSCVAAPMSFDPIRRAAGLCVCVM